MTLPLSTERDEVKKREIVSAGGAVWEEVIEEPLPMNSCVSSCFVDTSTSQRNGATFGKRFLIIHLFNS